MANQAVAFFMIHPNRSKEVFEALIKDWTGILASDGYGVYQKWVGQRQTCLAHLIRKVTELKESVNPDIAKCGKWAKAELQRLCKMANSPPTQGQWNAFYARLVRLISIYEDRQDNAGRFARRLLREIEHLWTFLVEEGVAPTNNHAEQMLRFAVLWRKRSYGTRSEKGNRWVERILSLRQTCRLRNKKTLRHSFAVYTLLKVKERGGTPQNALPLLATYMGHSEYKYTSVYLRVTDALSRKQLVNFSLWHERKE